MAEKLFLQLHAGLSCSLERAIYNYGYRALRRTSHFCNCKVTVPPGGYSHIRTVRVRAARKSPIFRPWPLLKTLPFRPGLLQKTPFSKINNYLFRFSDLGRSKRPSFLKNIRFCKSLLFLAPKSPVFPVSGRSESPPFSARDHSLSPPFLNPVRYIYTNFISPPGTVPCGTSCFFDCMVTVPYEERAVTLNARSKCPVVERWLSGRVSDSGARGPGFETYRRRVVSLSKTLYSPKVLVNYPGSDGSVPT